MSTVPFLPGHTSVSTKRDFKKSHLFDVKNGLSVLNDKGSVTLNNDVDLSIAQYSQEFDATQTRPANAELRRAPAWVAYDRKVLRFYGYFKEAVYASSQEKSRVRRVDLYYYMEDKTMRISEPKVENSGIPQGVFLKRHRIPKDNSEFVNLNDLNIGNEINIYGRTLRIYDADEATRIFFATNNSELGPAEGVPRDNWSKKHTAKDGVHNKIMYPMKQHMEASLGKMMGLDKAATQSFLQNDGRVLRLYCLWQDDNLYGEQRPYVIHYFLADGTVEVLEVAQPNSGRDSFSVFCKKAKLPKDHNQTLPNVARIGWSNDQSVQYYSEADFKIGAMVNVYGRNFQICYCDAFTKTFYMDNYGMVEEDFPMLLADDLQADVPIMAPPPATSYGTEEDSLGSFLYLTPKVPKKDFKKLMENNDNILSFRAKMVSAQAEDSERVFIIKFYMKDDKLSIFEDFKRNSGFVGGKFLEPVRMTNPDTEQFFACPDFKKGAKLKINSFTFELTEMDEWTRKFMEANPTHFTSQINATRGEVRDF